MAAPIEDYALIGDTHTAGLVSREGSIDWLCLPRFDSPACFAALLGDRSNGRWLLAPAGPVREVRRRYQGDTLVLETEYRTDDGIVRVVDCMPPRQWDPDVARIVEGVKGRVPMRMELTIRFDYGSIVPWVRNIDGALHAVAGPDSVWLRTPVPVRGENWSTLADFTMAEGERAPFMLTWHASHRPAPRRIDPIRALGDTEAWWGKWASHVDYGGGWPGPVIRSLLTLKALTYAPTGGGRAGLRGQGVAGVAAAGRGRPAAADADPLRGGRRAAHHRAGASLAARLRAVGAGADRQRGREPVPARRLRRGHGHPAPGPPHRPGERRGGLGPAAGPARVPGVEVARARRGHLGDPRSPAALHPLQGDGLGRPRPGHQGGRADGPRRPGGPLAGGPARAPRRGLPRGLRRRARHLRAVLRGRPPGRQPAPDPPGRVPARRRPAGQGHGGRHPARADRRRPGPPLPARRVAVGGRAAPRRGDLPGLHLLAGRQPGPDGPA